MVSAVAWPENPNPVFNERASLFTPSLYVDPDQKNRILWTPTRRSSRRRDLPWAEAKFRASSEEQAVVARPVRGRKSGGDGAHFPSPVRRELIPSYASSSQLYLPFYLEWTIS